MHITFFGAMKHAAGILKNVAIRLFSNRKYFIGNKGNRYGLYV